MEGVNVDTIMQNLKLINQKSDLEIEKIGNQAFKVFEEKFQVSSYATEFFFNLQII